MIRVLGSEIEPSVIMEQYPSGSVERQVLSIMSASSEVYTYNSPDQLKFELLMRRKIIEASIELNNSYFSFSTFRKSRCNPDYWERTGEGGFMLKRDVKPSEAIRDIYSNSRLYSTECATAIVIVYYGSLVTIFPEGLFDQVFSRIYLMDWQHLDRTMGIQRSLRVADYLPGDCRYFRNPDVDPVTPEWQGENAIYFGDNTYYGHGIGIGPAEKFIAVLNNHRISGSQTSAYLLDSATRPNFKRLADIYNSYNPDLQ